MKDGAGALHRWVKREAEVAETCVTLQGAYSAAPGDIVEHDFKEWKLVWDKLRSWQQAPWREEDGKYACDRSAALPDIGASQLRKAAATFSDRTGWGWIT